MSDETERYNLFLVELAALTRKHGVAVGGCGCCGSPYLLADAKVSDPRAGYVHRKGEEVHWVEPSDLYDWKENASRIVYAEGHDTPT